MLTINKLLPRGHGLSPVLLKRAAQVSLDWDTRQKSRFDAIDSQGRTLGVFLARGTLLRGGDVLVADDGSLVRVVAEPQPVLRVAPCADHATPFDLLRAAYHLGNRHVALQLAADHLQLEPDHVLAEMLRQMHLTVVETSAAFEPEGGAYAAGAANGRDHGQGQGHSDHGHEQAPGHNPNPSPSPNSSLNHAHVHDHKDDHGPRHDRRHESGQAQGHDHGHGHAHGHAHGPGCTHDH